MEEDVVGFDVAVHDVVFLQGFERGEQLFEVEEGLTLGEAALAFDEVLQCAAVAVFVDEVEVVYGAQHLFEADDVGAGLDIRQGL